LIPTATYSSFRGGQKDEFMTSILPHIARIRKLFPERADEIARLALRDDTFRTVCEDYGMALEALTRLEIRNHPLDVEKLIEYRALIHDLEGEIKAGLAQTDIISNLTARTGGRSE
jgi:hypothetical protein